MLPKGVEDKVLVVDNAFSDQQIQDMKTEIDSLKNQWLYDGDSERYSKYRIDLDIVYQNRRSESKILLYVIEILFNDNLINKLKHYNDFAYKLLGVTDYHKTYVTSHIHNKMCSWHKDDSTHTKGVIQTMNFIFYLDIGGEFTEGELCVSYDEIDQHKVIWKPIREPTIHQKIEYKHNRLVMLPTWLWHYVTTIKTKNEKTEPMDGRISVNGHIGFKR